MTAAAGTVTLSEMKSTAPTIDVHLYTKLFDRDNFSERGYFDTGLFYNTEEFTMRSNEQHKMLLHGSSIDKAEYTVYRAQLVDDELSIDLQHEPGLLCYAITLLTPDATLTVGPKTSLSLLLKSAQLHVTTYMVTEKQANQLTSPLQERDQVRRQVDAIFQAAESVVEETNWQAYHKEYPKVTRAQWKLTNPFNYNKRPRFTVGRNPHLIQFDPSHLVSQVPPPTQDRSADQICPSLM